MTKKMSESIFEHENHERDRDTNDKKMDFIGLEHNMQSNVIDSSPRYPLHQSIDWKMHHVYRLIPFYLEHEEEATL